jgi:O-antigen ligase
MLNRAAFFGLCGSLIWAPLPFGSFHVWAYTVMVVFVYSSLGLYVLDQAWPTRKSPTIWVRTPVTPCLLLFFLVIWLQLTPLPAPLTAIVSPQAHADQLSMASIFQDVSRAETEFFWMRISYALGTTMMEGIKVGAFLGGFFLSLHLLRTKQRIDILIYVLVAVGVFEALYAIYQTFSLSPRIFWWSSRAGGHRYASGTFTVSNHFCFYLEMLVPLTVGLAFSRIKRKRRLIPGLSHPRALIQRMVSRLSPDSPTPIGMILGGAALVMGGALLLSASRGGILSMGAAAFIMSALFFFRPDGRKHSLAILAICVLVFGYGLSIGMKPTLQKFEQTQGLASRLYTSWTLLPIIGDYPVAGVGLGNLRYIYYRYTQPDIPVPYSGVWTAGHAHNDWLELFTEAGVVGGGLVLVAYLVFLRRLIYIWRRRQNPHAVGIGAGVITGMIAVGLHGFFDFSMRIPANPLTLAAVAAIGYAALHRQGPDYNESFFYRTRSFHLSPVSKGLVGVAALVVMGGAIWVSVRHFQAEAYCPTQYNSTLNLNWSPAVDDIEKAISRFPWNPEYHLKRARHFANVDPADDSHRRRLIRQSVEGLQTALRLNPAQPHAWYLLGRQYARRRQDISEYFDRWLPLSDRCMDMSLSYAPREESTLARAAMYWTWRTAILPVESPDDALSRSEGIKKLQDLFQQYLTVVPQRWRWAVKQVHQYHPSPQVLLGLAPPENKDMKRDILQWTVTADGGK